MIFRSRDMTNSFMSQIHEMRGSLVRSGFVVTSDSNNAVCGHTFSHEHGGNVGLGTKLGGVRSEIQTQYDDARQVVLRDKILQWHWSNITHHDEVYVHALGRRRIQDSGRDLRKIETARGAGLVAHKEPDSAKLLSGCQ
jgi:hypothetical protein